MVGVQTPTINGASGLKLNEYFDKAAADFVIWMFCCIRIKFMTFGWHQKIVDYDWNNISNPETKILISNELLKFVELFKFAHIKWINSSSQYYIELRVAWLKHFHTFYTYFKTINITIHYIDIGQNYIQNPKIIVPANVKKQFENCENGRITTKS